MTAPKRKVSSKLTEKEKKFSKVNKIDLKTESNEDTLNIVV